MANEKGRKERWNWKHEKTEERERSKKEGGDNNAAKGGPSGIRQTKRGSRRSFSIEW